MQRLAIIGSGDLGRQIAYYANAMGSYKVIGFLDDFEKPGTVKHGIEILGGIDILRKLYAQDTFDVLMIGIGYKHMQKRAAVFREHHGKIPFARIIHPSCIIDPSSRIEEGVIIFPGCVIDCNSYIGPNVLIYTGCTISHDVKIGAHSMLAPAIKTSGFVDIGECVTLGTGTVIIDHIKITANVITGAGSVVVNDLLEAGLYYGVPAKLKLKHGTL
ncbi:MAG: acetyltransferase [Chitinophagales bacterium]|nr:acetyltransferase [Chitinophagales bacterium]MDW8418237.1 acetyltransferase [Chitinophagales bacterium]